VSELQQKVSELAALMMEFGLEHARLQGENFRIEFDSVSRSSESKKSTDPLTAVANVSLPKEERPQEVRGTPVSSPMMGIFYSAPSPGAEPFVAEGDEIIAGQVVGLIEAMKVFNEITATVSGKVLAIVAADGGVVQPGEPLLYIG